MTILHGKRMLITGAASGIGRATAQLAARKGAKLVLTDLDAGKLDETVAEIRRQALRAVANEPEIIGLDEAEVRRRFAFYGDAFGVRSERAGA